MELENLSEKEAEEYFKNLEREEYLASQNILKILSGFEYRGITNILINVNRYLKEKQEKTIFHL